VIIPDLNLLLYAEIAAFPLHAAARKWLEDALSGREQVGFAPVCVFGFIRMATNRRVFTDPLSIDAAVRRVEAWLARPQASLLVAGSRHLEIAFGLLRELGAGGNLTTDVQIAAHAIEYGAEVHSNDHDFARFDGLRLVNPLRR
jgi:toxin-antitoxin system PIN domain toxin